MRILISLPYFPAPNTGTGNAVYGFAKGLIANGAQTMVLAEGKNNLKSIYDKVPYLVFKKNKYLSTHLPSKALKRYLKENKTKIDLVILNGIYVPYMFFLGNYLKSIEIKYVLVPHSVYSKISFEKSYLKKKIYFKLFEKRLIEGALAVQMFSDKQLDQLRLISKPKDTLCVSNGIDIDLGNDDNNTTTKRQNKSTKLIFLGRKEVHMKGLDLLLMAFSKLQHLNINLYIQGTDIGETHILNSIITEKKIKNVFLLERYNGNVVSYLDQFDILILPSRYEAFAMTVVEAMLAKMPVLVSSQAGAAVHVSNADSGMVFEPSLNGIYDGILNILERKSEWEQMGLNGYNYAKIHLSWESIANKALSEYKSLFIKNV